MPLPPSGSLGSQPPPPPTDDDHVRGEGTLVIEYSDLQCPWCAHTDGLLNGLPVRRVLRHFPVSSKHPRARALAHAVEAAAAQGRFWDMHDSLLADPARIDDPHLWDRCRELGLDLDRFQADRRSDLVAARVARDFRSGIRAGVVTTPTLFVDGTAYSGVPGAELLDRLAG